MEESEDQRGMVCEPMASYAIPQPVDTVMPDDISYASVVDGVLQMTPDLEREIAESESGGFVSMQDFRQRFARWID